ncbi:MAG TPA: SpoIIE family protein phosphatase [Verrucomicrobiae bacterium]|nr:SpoIIE family protein phosphatase [Verrucomicrobiae bacterium]
MNSPHTKKDGVDLDLSKIRHELRTPINHILGYCDILLEEETIPDSFRSDLAKIHNGGRQLLSLINHYFDEKTFAALKLDAHQLFHELRTPVNHIIGYSELLEEQARETGCANFIPDLRKINKAAETWLALMEENLLPVRMEAGVERLVLDPGVGFLTPAPKSFAPAERQTGALLVVDDDPANREMLQRRLEKDGYTVTVADNGLSGLKLIRSHSFDLVLLDLIMPGLDGYQVLAKLKGDPILQHVPVIMISALDQENGIARCIEMGAEDYIAKPFNPVFLRARIGASLEKKRLRDQEQKIYRALVASQQKIAANLGEAAQHVVSLLPRKMTVPFIADYLFQPCSELGGDIFGYHWLDQRHFAIYLLDVSGHGIGAALLSVSVMNVLRSRTMGGVNFCSPAEVLGALNEMFQMENHNNLFFTIWYGVYDTQTRALRYASAGHPPALLIRQDSLLPLIPLRTDSPAIGCLVDYLALEAEISIGPSDRLLVVSDGVFELVKTDGTPATYSDLEVIVAQLAPSGLDPGRILSEAQRLQGQANFEDDFSLLLVKF